MAPSVSDTDANVFHMIWRFFFSPPIQYKNGRVTRDRKIVRRTHSRLKKNHSKNDSKLHANPSTLKLYLLPIYFIYLFFFTQTQLRRIIRLGKFLKRGSKPEVASLHFRVIHQLTTYDLGRNSSDRLQAPQQRTEQVSWQLSHHCLCSMSVSRPCAASGPKSVSFTAVIWLCGYGAGCWWVRSLLQRVVQLFWTSSWLALATPSPS